MRLGDPEGEQLNTYAFYMISELRDDRGPPSQMLSPQQDNEQMSMVLTERFVKRNDHSWRKRELTRKSSSAA